MWWITKKQLKNQIAELRADLECLEGENMELTYELGNMISTFPFTIGETVYDVQLRSATGRFTKKNPSKEHSIINEVVVSKKNYFNLVERFNNFDVFRTLTEAEAHIDHVCVQ